MPRTHTPEELEVIARALAAHLQETAIAWMNEHHGPDVLYMQDAGAVVLGALNYNVKGVTASLAFMTPGPEGAPY